MIDHGIKQRERTRELEKQGYVLIAKDVPKEVADNAARNKTWPVGTLWFWAIEEAWSPK